MRSTGISRNVSDDGFDSSNNAQNLNTSISLFNPESGKMAEGLEESEKAYSPVWISTFDHMKTYSWAMDKSSFREKMRGDYDVPVDFPYLQMTQMKYVKWLNIFVVLFSGFLLITFYLSNSIMFFPYLFMLAILGIWGARNRNRKKNPKIPVHFLASGKLLISDSGLSFTAEPYIVSRLIYYNLQSNLHFQLDYADIERLERFAPHEEFEGYSGLFSNVWIRIYTREELLGGDFLLVVGGSGVSIRSQRKQTNEIYQHLNKLIQEYS